MHNPTVEELRTLAAEDKSTLEHQVPTTTTVGSSAYVSKVRSRSAKHTRSKVDGEWLHHDEETVAEVEQYVKEHAMVSVDRVIGERKRYQKVCRLLVSRDYARIAHGWSELLLEPDHPYQQPDFVTYYIPEWNETAILIDAEKGKTYVLGTDYIGEAKKSFLRQDMYHIKQVGGLGLHAGSKLVSLTDHRGRMKTIGQLYFGLSATGKSTLTGHGFFLDEPEYTSLVQDDVVRFLPHGAALGTEGKGLYIKTDGLNAEEQPEMYAAATSPHAILENVFVAPDGKIDFHDTSLTKNGRATVLRSDIPNAYGTIDLYYIEQVFFITRNPLVPPIAKLTPEQAACAFMLGESVESSAGDPTKAGQAVRVVGTNPFVMGPKGEEGNRFLDILRENEHMQCYLLNTGHLGTKGTDHYKDIGLRETIETLVAVTRGTAEWEYDTMFSLALPKGTAGSDNDPRTYFDNDVFSNLVHQQYQDRQAWLEQFPTLHPEIREAVY